MVIGHQDSQRPFGRLDGFRLFGGRVSPLVAQLAGQDQLSADDIAELEEILKGLKS